MRISELKCQKEPYKRISTVIQRTARGGLPLSFVCDFGEWLERLASVEAPRIFFISCFDAGYEKKGACLARIVKKRIILQVEKSFLTPITFCLGIRANCAPVRTGDVLGYRSLRRSCRSETGASKGKGQTASGVR